MIGLGGQEGDSDLIARATRNDASHWCGRILALLLTLVLFACSGNPSTEQANLDDPDTPGGEPDALALTAESDTTNDARPTTLQVTGWKGNEAEPSGLPELIEEFERAHPTINVELEYISRIDSEIALARRMDEGNPPDVMMTDLPLAEPFANAGQLMDLGQDSEWYARISPNLQLALTDEKSDVHTMPVEMTGMGNFVNLDLLEQAGVPHPPRTVEELTEACRLLDDAGIKPLVFTGSFSAALFVVANGLETTESSAYDLGSGRASFADSASFNEGLNFVDELIAARCFDPGEQAALDPWRTALTAFKDGQVAMMPQGAWNIAAFNSVEDLRYTMTPIPSRNEPGVAIELFGFGWSIPVQTNHPKEAQAFVDWMALPQNIQVVLDVGGGFTPFDDGSTGSPITAASFNEARANGAAVSYPPTLLQWPKGLEGAIWDSLTAMLLDLDTTNNEVLSSWDEHVRSVVSE